MQNITTDWTLTLRDNGLIFAEMDCELVVSIGDESMSIDIDGGSFYDGPKPGRKRIPFGSFKDPTIEAWIPCAVYALETDDDFIEHCHNLSRE